MKTTTMDQAVLITNAHYFVRAVKVLNPVELEVTYKNENVEIEIPFHNTPYNFYCMLTDQDNDFDQHETMNGANDKYAKEMMKIVDSCLSQETSQEQG